MIWNKRAWFVYLTATTLTLRHYIRTVKGFMKPLIKPLCNYLTILCFVLKYISFQCKECLKTLL